MNHLFVQLGVAPDIAEAPLGSEPTPESDIRPVRALHRAAAELRRGTPVLLTETNRTGDGGLVLLPAETASARGLQEFAALAGAKSLLLLAPSRAAALLHRPMPPEPEEAVALLLPRALRTPAALAALADPTLPQPKPADSGGLTDCPASAGAALMLAKLARLLPAVLAAPAVADVAERLAALSLLAVRASDVLAYPGEVAANLTRVAEARVPLEDAPDSRIIAYRAAEAGLEHLAILVGHPEQSQAPLVRLHSECFTGDLLGSLRCDCGEQLRGAIRRMAAEGAGVLLYLAQEGRGIGLVNKLRAYALQERGLDTLDANRALGWGADERNFLVAATMLEDLGIREVRLLTNNPDKIAALAACGLKVKREAHIFAANGVNDRYLATKVHRFGHLLG
jgi:GTP cyclohydrolase II